MTKGHTEARRLSFSLLLETRFRRTAIPGQKASGAHGRVGKFFFALSPRLAFLKFEDEHVELNVGRIERAQFAGVPQRRRRIASLLRH